MKTTQSLHRMNNELEQPKQELNGERQAWEHAEATHELISTETELEATRRLLEEERKRCLRIQSEPSEKQKEAVVAQQTSIQELARVVASAREVVTKAHEEIAQATEKLTATQVELEARGQALDDFSEKLAEALVSHKPIYQELEDEREAGACSEASLRETAAKAWDEVALVEEREHCGQNQYEKHKEMLSPTKIRFQELEDEIQARALVEASLKEAAAKAHEERDEAVEQLNAAEAELKATCQALAEERKHCKRILRKASKRENELMLSLENSIKTMNDERKQRMSASKAKAKARDEKAEAVKQSRLTNQKLVAAEAELEATRQTLAEERQRYRQIQFEACEKHKEALLSQRTIFLNQLRAHVDIAEKALHLDT